MFNGLNAILLINIRTIEPRPELALYLRKISVFESAGRIKYKHKLTPSPYTYISYNSKDIPVSIIDNKRVHPKQRLQVTGPKINKDIYVEYRGYLSQILIEFTASGFYHLFHVSPVKLVDYHSKLSHFMSNESFQRLEYAINAEPDTERQIKLLEDSLIEMSYTATPVNRYIEKGLQVIEDSHGGALINEIIKSSGISERQFNRRFREVTGITPKCFSKIIQLHNVISLMQKKQYKSLNDISFKAYFYDMSHFAHRFKELTGFTPAGFIRSDKHIAMKYYSDPT